MWKKSRSSCLLGVGVRLSDFVIKMKGKTWCHHLIFIKKTENIGLIFFLSRNVQKKLREHNSQVTNRYNRTICNLFINSLYTTKYNRASSFLNIALHINRRYWTTLLTRSIPQFIKTVKSVGCMFVVYRWE